MLTIWKSEEHFNVEIDQLGGGFSTIEMLTGLTGILNSYWEQASKEYSEVMGIDNPNIDDVRAWVDFQKEAGF